jgi:hypothetical protein
LLCRCRLNCPVFFHPFQVCCDVVHTPDLSSPLPVRVRGCRLVRCTSKVTHSTTCNVQRTSESAPGSGVAFRAA